MNTLRFTLCVCLITALSGGAGGDVIQELNSPDYAVRVAASERLITDSTLTSDTIRAWLHQPELSIEQRHRLLGAAKHHLLREIAAEQFPLDPLQPPGRIAMGFGHQPSSYVNEQGQAMGAVLVVRTLPGLPAHGRLRPGDQVARVGGLPLPAEFQPDDFAQLIARLPANQPIQLSVLRESEMIQLELPASRMTILASLYNQDSQLEEPYRNRWHEFLTSIEQP